MNFEIQKEHLAERCEVCHKSDCFDALSNSCNRCCRIVLPQPKSLIRKSYNICFVETIKDITDYKFIDGILCKVPIYKGNYFDVHPLDCDKDDDSLVWVVIRPWCKLFPVLRRERIWQSILQFKFSWSLLVSQPIYLLLRSEDVRFDYQ